MESEATTVAPPRVHVPASAAIIEITRQYGTKVVVHYEIEWRGTEGKERSGQPYWSRQQAEGLAIECGAREVTFEIEGSRG